MKKIIITSILSLLIVYSFAQCGGGTITGFGTFCTLNVSGNANLNVVATGTWNGNPIDATTYVSNLANVATSGDYNDLTNKPSIPSIPVGALHQFAGSSAPTGYLLCDGAAISRTTYSDLFGVVGTTYGSGDGSTTFNLPDLRQRFPIGVATSGTGSTIGSTGGTIDHIHTVDPPNTTSTGPSATSNVTNTLATFPVASSSSTHDVDISQFNSGTANPPFIALHYIIKY